MTTELLTLDHLSVYQDVAKTKQILNQVSFSIAPGEIFCLVGKSGTGKSVIAKAILHLLPKALQASQEGVITFADQAIQQYTNRQMTQIRGRGIGMIFQDSLGALNPIYKVQVQMADVFRKAEPKLKAKAIKAKSIDLLKQVDIQDPEAVLRQYPFELSGGMCQRIMIAIALIQQPQLLIADEPTTSLDVITQNTILSVLKRLNREREMAILFITHDLGVVHKIADRIAVINAGQIEEIQPRVALFAHPQAAYTQKLLDSMLKVPALAEAQDGKS